MDFSLSSSLVGNAVSNPDKLALDLQFALDKTLTARKGPTPVFTRGSGATFVDSDKLVKWAHENLTIQSENFGATWLMNNSTITPNTVVAPDGAITADRLNEDATSNNHQVIQGVGSLIGGQPHTFSVFAKAASHTSFQMTVSTTAFGSGMFANFLLTGSGSIGTSSNVTTSIERYPDGWYRCSITVSSVGGGAGGFVQIAANNNNSSSIRLPVYLGTNAQVVHLWGAQLERSSTARTYNPTTTAVFYGPRFDHDPVTGVCKGLLMEESRTNTLLQSEAFDSASWAGAGKNLTVTPDTIVAPSGILNADKLTVGATTTTYLVVQTTPNFVSGTTYTVSCFFKADQVTRVALYATTAATFPANAIFDLTASGSVVQNTFGVASIIPYANGWYRCQITGTAGANVPTSIRISPVTGTSLNYVGNSIDSFYAWGAQLELGSFPTSYIPTTTGTLARSGDVCTISSTAFSNMWNRFSGTVVMRATEAGNENSRWISTDVGQRTFDIIGKTNLKFFEGGGGTTVTIVNMIALPATIGLAYAVNDYQSAYNGLLGGSDTNTGATFPNPTFLDIGRLNTLQQLCGCISFIRYYKKRLPNSKLQAITV